MLLVSSVQVFFFREDDQTGGGNRCCGRIGRRERGPGSVGINYCRCTFIYDKSACLHPSFSGFMFSSEAKQRCCNFCEAADSLVFDRLEAGLSRRGDIVESGGRVQRETSGSPPKSLRFLTVRTFKGLQQSTKMQKIRISACAKLQQQISGRQSLLFCSG